MLSFNKIIAFFSFIFVLNLFVQNRLFALVEQETPAYIIPEEILVSTESSLHLKKRYDEFTVKHSPLFNRVNSRLEFWREQDRWADRFGFEESGFHFEKSREEKSLIIQDEFFRYFRRQTRRPLRAQIDEWQEDLERNNEIDENANITNSQSIFIYDNYSYQDYLDKKENKSEKLKSRSDKNIKIAKSYKLRFKPRLFKGVLITQLTNPIVNVNSVVGVNQQVEVNLSKHFQKAQLFANFNFNVAEETALLSFDKKLNPNLTVRLSAQENNRTGAKFQDTMLVSFNFFKRF